MKGLYLIFILCIANLKGSVLKVNDDLSCANVKSNLAKIHDTLQMMNDINKDLQDPTVPPTSTVQLLNTELNKYKIPFMAHKNCETAQEKATIEGLRSFKSKMNNTVTQYTKINVDLNKRYADECKDPASQSTKALADDVTKTYKTISETKVNCTNEFNQIVGNVKLMPQDIFFCLMKYTFDSINTVILNFNATMCAKVESKRDILSSILRQNLTRLAYAVEKIQRFDQKHQNMYLKTCRSEPNVNDSINASLLILQKYVFDIHVKVVDFVIDNLVDQFDKIEIDLGNCVNPQCIDSCWDAMHAMKMGIVIDLEKYTKNVTSLIESTQSAVVEDFNRQIDKHLECYLKVLSSGTSDLFSFKMSLVSLILLVLANLTVTKM